MAEWSIAFVLKTNGRDERSRGSNPFLSANIIYMETILCGYCGKPLERKNAKFCSSKCSEAKKHELSYKDFLENNDKYCRGNYTPKHFKSDFLKEQNNVCAICGGPTEHNGKPLVFILDHIDGDASNNKRENLRMICPNCDSQLETYKSKNKNSTRRNYWKDKIIRDIQGNIQQTIELDNK